MRRLGASLFYCQRAILILFRARARKSDPYNARRLNVLEIVQCERERRERYIPDNLFLPVR